MDRGIVMYGDFMPRNPELDPNAETAAMPMMGMRSLDHHMTSHDPIAIAAQSGHFRLYPPVGGGRWLGISKTDLEGCCHKRKDDGSSPDGSGILRILFEAGGGFVGVGSPWYGVKAGGGNRLSGFDADPVGAITYSLQRCSDGVQPGFLGMELGYDDFPLCFVIRLVDRVGALGLY